MVHIGTVTVPVDVVLNRPTRTGQDKFMVLLAGILAPFIAGALIMLFAPLAVDGLNLGYWQSFWIYLLIQSLGLNTTSYLTSLVKFPDSKRKSR